MYECLSSSQCPLDPKREQMQSPLTNDLLLERIIRDLDKIKKHLGVL